MKIIFSFIAVLISFSNLFADRIERKIIIQDSNYYFFTIDESTQLANLYTGKTSVPTSQALPVVLPIGRRLSQPFQPFCYDINGKNIIAINQIKHPLNSPLFSLKKIPVSYQNMNAENARTLLLSSFKQKDVAIFTPWQFMTQQNNILENTLIDIAVDGDSIYTAIHNHGQLIISLWDGKAWKAFPPATVNYSSYFSLFFAGKQLMLLDQIGQLLTFNRSSGKPEKSYLINQTNYNADDYVMLINKDSKSTCLLKRNLVESGKYSIDELTKMKDVLILK